MLINVWEIHYGIEYQHLDYLKGIGSKGIYGPIELE